MKISKVWLKSIWSVFFQEITQWVGKSCKVKNKMIMINFKKALFTINIYNTQQTMASHSTVNNMETYFLDFNEINEAGNIIKKKNKKN